MMHDKYAVCNYCMLKGLEEVARRSGASIVMKKAPNFELAVEGVDVSILYPDSEQPTWVAWFTALPDHCVCGAADASPPRS